MMPPLINDFQNVILSATGASRFEVVGVIEDLWSGYGKILRVRLFDAPDRTVVVKHVRLPTADKHPRGWNSDHSRQRKIKSYQIEAEFYRHWSGRCGEGCRTPRYLGSAREEGETLLVLEDLDAAGFSVRRTNVNKSELEACLKWLADFHATFMGEAPEGLWPVGSYWHLGTRRDEWEALDDRPLKQAAAEIDLLLTQACYQTLVHGDAKLANFCFSDDGSRVAALDFQYVGGGCGMKDVAYFIGSCLDEANCETQANVLLDYYFSALREALQRHHPEVDAVAVETEWRMLFPIAWTDFHRFLKGWSPGHWKINGYSERLAREVVAGLGQAAPPCNSPGH